MNEMPVRTNADEDDLDSLALCALLSSRVCHDLINPVGAIGSGLEVLDDPELEGGMREAALELIRSGASKAIALLKYARIAYGAGGAYGAEISLDDVHSALGGVYESLKPTLDWRLGGGMAPKDNAKVLLILAYAAADCAPRGGEITISGAINEFTITATGKKLYLAEDLTKAFAGDARGIAPKFTPALIAAQIVANQKGQLTAQRVEDKVFFNVKFGNCS